MVLKAFGTCIGPLGFPMQDEDARALEKLLDTGEYGSFNLAKAVEPEGIFAGERAEISVLTDDSVDKEGDVIPPEVLNWDQFEKAGKPVAYNHNYDLPPVGRAMWFKRIGNLFKGKTQYFDKPEDYPRDKIWFSDSIWYLVKSGVLRGKSIGGAIQWRQPTKEDVETNPKWSGASRIAKAAKVFEYSVCTIAMNNNSVVEVLKKGLVKLPEDILKNDFPEVYEEMQKAQPSIPVIGKFKTVEQYKAEKEAIYTDQLRKLQKNIPTLIDNHLRRLTGKVV